MRGGASTALGRASCIGSDGSGVTAMGLKEGMLRDWYGVRRVGLSRDGYAPRAVLD